MRRTLTTVVLAAVVGASSATAAIAAFPDTGSSAFRDEIDNVAEAGCATGFPDGTFRPRDAVNRQQFAAWMNRCGGRVEFARTASPLTLGSDLATVLAEVTMAAGAVQPGGGFLLAQATFGARDAGTAADVTFRLLVDGVPVDTVPLTAPAEAAVRGSTQVVVPLAGGAGRTVTLTAQRGPGVEVAADGALSLLYVPFAGDGSGGAGE